jgi:hypothetical protein
MGQKQYDTAGHKGSATEKRAKFWNAAEQFLNKSPRNMYYFFNMLSQ